MDIINSKNTTTAEIENTEETFEDKKIIAGSSSGDPLSSSISEKQSMTLSGFDDSGDPVEITKEEKEEYLNSILENRRFYLTEKIFGGSITVKFRCRTMEETEAIRAYLYRIAKLNSISTEAEYTGALIRALLVAQVEEINGVHYDEMKTPLKFSETKEGLTPPAWELDLNIWKSKPEAMIVAIGNALKTFESKYWAMTKASTDANFWHPAESIGN